MGCCSSNASPELSRLQSECDLLRDQLVSAVRSKPFTEDTLALNGVLEHLWPHLSDSIAKSLAKDLEPSIKLALSKLPSPLNKCAVKETSHLGTKALKILAPQASWSSLSSFTVNARLEWDSDSSISLSFTGASLGIINFTIIGDFTLELLLLPGKSATEFLSALRVFFPTPPDIQFALERSQLALAANVVMLHRVLLKVMSQKTSEKLVFPNCQGLSLSPKMDLLDVKQPPVEGLLSLNIQIWLVAPGAVTVETVFGSTVYSSDFKAKNGSDALQLPKRCFAVHSILHQHIVVKLKKKAATSADKPSFFRIRIADLIYRTKDGPWLSAFQSDGDPDALQSTANALTLTTEWWPRSASSEGKDIPHVISVGIYSAHGHELRQGTLFWVVARLDKDILPAQRTIQKMAEIPKSSQGSADAMRALLAEKRAILEKYHVSNEDMAKILEERPRVKWLQRLDFMLFHAATSTSPKSLTMELWQKAGGKETKIGTVVVDVTGCDQQLQVGKMFKVDGVAGNELLLEFRLQRIHFSMKDLPELPPETGGAWEEAEASDATFSPTAADAVHAAHTALAAVGGIAVTGARAVADEGLAAVGGAYAAAQAGIEGLSSTWGFATDTQPSPKSEEPPAGSHKKMALDRE